MFNFRQIAIASLGTLSIAFSNVQAFSDHPSVERWDLSHIYENEKIWHQDYEKAEIECRELSKLLAESNIDATQLTEILDRTSETKQLLARLYTYASLKSDEDLRVYRYKALKAKASALYAKFTTETSSITSKVLALAPSQIDLFLKQEPALEKHSFFLKDTVRQRKHLIAQQNSSRLAQGTSNSQISQFRKLQQQTIHWPTITLSGGDAASINPSSFAYYRTVSNPIDRTKVFNAYWKAVEPYADTYAQLLQKGIRQQHDKAIAQKYGTALAAHLATDNVPISVYTTVIEAAEENLPALHRVMALKQRMLGLTKLKYEDLYAPLRQQQPFFSLPEAETTLLASTALLGNEYTTILETGFMNHWMHALPQAGKRSGSYMQDAAYGVHPFILLNYRERYRDLNAFSHEWGHAIHSVFASKNTPYETSRYSRLTAELVAATSELMIEDFLIETARSSEKKLYYIYQALENIRTTFFHHAQIAAFELKLYDMVQNDIPFTSEKLNDLNRDALKRYWGNQDPTYAITWAMTPHYYDSFSIYKYATGIAGGALFIEKFSTDPESGVENYLDLLKAGGSDYPHELLKRAGIDLTTQRPYKALISRMERLLDQADDILKQQDH